VFDGAKVFGKAAAVLLGAALLAFPYIGCWLFLPVCVTLYFGLHYCNRLEARDRRDESHRRKQGR
jgi:hypothetical protein